MSLFKDKTLMITGGTGSFGPRKFSGGNFEIYNPGKILGGTVIKNNKIRGEKVEKWVDTPNNSKYQVSNTGRVRRLGSDKDCSTRDRKGYPSVDLYEHGQRTTRPVHRLVAEAFIPNPENRLEVNHIDGNKHNNNADNLEWVTHKENCRHAWDTGLIEPSRSMQGRLNPNAGRKGKPIRIIETGQVFSTLKECEKAIDGNNRHINDCLRGRQNTHRGYHFEYI